MCKPRAAKRDLYCLTISTVGSLKEIGTCARISGVPLYYVQDFCFRPFLMNPNVTTHISQKSQLSSIPKEKFKISSLTYCTRRN